MRVRSAFTLIELLVVLVVLTLIMGVVVPKGAKMLQNYQKSLNKMKSEQKLSKYKAEAFLQAQDINITMGKKIYHISKKGLVFEKSNDNY